MSVKDLFNLSGKKALITGGSRGWPTCGVSTCGERPDDV